MAESQLTASSLIFLAQFGALGHCPVDREKCLQSSCAQRVWLVAKWSNLLSCKIPQFISTIIFLPHTWQMSCTPIKSFICFTSQKYLMQRSQTCVCESFCPTSLLFLTLDSPRSGFSLKLCLVASSTLQAEDLWGIYFSNTDTDTCIRHAQ